MGPKPTAGQIRAVFCGVVIVMVAFLLLACETAVNIGTNFGQLLAPVLVE